MEFRVEYLVLKQAGTFCDSQSAFICLLQLDSSLKVENNSITFNSFSSRIDVQCDETDNKKQRYFRLCFTAKVDNENVDSDIEKFCALLKVVRRVILKAIGKDDPIDIHVLWDDISSHYSMKAYPVINNLENLMRKLIDSFMLIKVGTGWVHDASPRDFSEAIAKNRRQNDNTPLHRVDFIELSNVLLKPYSKRTVDQLYIALKDTDGVLTPEEQKDFLPLSNWQRYFSGIVECESDYLRVRWEKLYDLRCQVAHNAEFSRSDYDSMVSLVNEIMPKMQDALDKINQIHIPNDEQEAIIENATSSVQDEFDSYNIEWQTLRSVLLELAEICGIECEDTDYTGVIRRRLLQEKVISFSESKSIERYHKIRNVIIDDPEQVSSSRYTLAVQSLQDFTARIRSRIEFANEDTVTHESEERIPDSID